MDFGFSVALASILVPWTQNPGKQIDIDTCDCWKSKAILSLHSSASRFDHCAQYGTGCGCLFHSVSKCTSRYLMSIRPPVLQTLTFNHDDVDQQFFFWTRASVFQSERVPYFREASWLGQPKHTIMYVNARRGKHITMVSGRLQILRFNSLIAYQHQYLLVQVHHWQRLVLRTHILAGTLPISLGQCTCSLDRSQFQHFDKSEPCKAPRYEFCGCYFAICMLWMKLLQHTINCMTRQATLSVRTMCPLYPNDSCCRFFVPSRARLRHFPACIFQLRPCTTLLQACLFNWIVGHAQIWWPKQII